MIKSAGFTKLKKPAFCPGRFQSGKAAFNVAKAIAIPPSAAQTFQLRNGQRGSLMTFSPITFFC